jgi:hypothetical protein
MTRRLLMVCTAAITTILLVAQNTDAAEISITVTNASNDSSNVRVFDLFAGGKRDVNNGAPFALAAGETTPPITINTDTDAVGTIEWNCTPGGGLTGVTVQNGAAVQACH